jgi:hypothetical protein
MQVVITEAQLKSGCDVYLKSPEWDPEQRALVYIDWAATVERLLSTRSGTAYLDSLVSRGFVPMTKDEFIAARKAHRGF